MMIKIEYDVYNPENIDVNDLPVIYGFNNGGRAGFFEGVLITQDGTFLGSHLCSSEGYMYGDLGILKGSRSDRHDHFKKHYPSGYRMDFVSYDKVSSHAGIQDAFKRSKPIEDDGQFAKVEITFSDGSKLSQ